MRFCEALKLLMLQTGVTGAELGERLGVSQRTISRYTTGEVVPNDEKKRKLIAAFNTVLRHSSTKKKVKTLDDSIIMDLRDALCGSSGLPEYEYIGYASEDDAYDMADFDYDELVSGLNHKIAALPKEQQDNLRKLWKPYCAISSLEFFLLERLQMCSVQQRTALLEDMERYGPVLRPKETPEKEVLRKIVQYWSVLGDLDTSPPTEDFTVLLGKSGWPVLALFDAALHKLLELNEEDWYFLLLLQHMTLTDSGYHPIGIRSCSTNSSAADGAFDTVYSQESQDAKLVCDNFAVGERLLSMILRLTYPEGKHHYLLQCVAVQTPHDDDPIN